MEPGSWTLAGIAAQCLVAVNRARGSGAGASHVGWPRAVAYPRLPQIRTCPIRASGSSDDGFAAHRTQLRYLAGLRRDDLPAQCPRHLSLRKLRSPVGRFPSAGSSGASSPTSPVLSADSDFSPPFAPRFVSFARHYHRFAALRSPGARRFPEDLDYFYRGARAASHRWRKRDLPGSWTTLAYMLRSPTPADHRPQATTAPVMVSSAPLTTSTPR